MQEAKIRDLYLLLVQNNWNILDIGAFEGIHSLILSELTTGKVFAFEPCLDNFNTLKNNTRDRKNIYPINMAVSNIDGEINLYYGRNDSFAEFNIRGKDLEEVSTRSYGIVKSTSIDSYFKLSQKIDFVKIDVEGAENLVLEGMKRTLSKYQPMMIIEFHNDEGWQGYKILQELNYQILDVYDNLKPLPFLETRQTYHGIAVPGKYRHIFE